jgi:hypothetical protein
MKTLSSRNHAATPRRGLITPHTREKERELLIQLLEEKIINYKAIYAISQNRDIKLNIDRFIYILKPIEKCKI